MKSTQIALLHHMLGLSADNQSPSRNHFVAGAGSEDGAELSAMLDAGLVKRCAPSEISGGDPWYQATHEGIAAAMAALPAKRALSPAKRRYKAFLRSDTGLTFGEFLRRRMYLQGGLS